MRKVLLFIKKLSQKVLAFIPTPLPKGIKEFEGFSQSICETFNIPFLPSYKHAIATMIMHLGPLEDRKSKIYFVKSIKKAMANQVAHEVRMKIQEEEKQEVTKEHSEVTSLEPIPQETSN